MVLSKMDLITSQIYFKEKSSLQKQKLLDRHAHNSALVVSVLFFILFAFLGVYSPSDVYKMYRYLKKLITRIMKT